MIATAVSEAMTRDEAARDQRIPRGCVHWDFGNDRLVPRPRGLTSLRSGGSKGVRTPAAVMQRWALDLPLRRPEDLERPGSARLLHGSNHLYGARELSTFPLDFATSGP